MTDEELKDALDGLYAYDEGAADSGIRDEGLRERCIAALRQRRDEEEAAAWSAWTARLVRDMFLTDERIAQGYGLTDAVLFIRWLEDRMGVLL